ncbi:MAG: hypothetical protein KAI43_12850 [Candidatus Aureabacteria bacterium]|nr:hypothetical protein [Candidatus Auribacterota bacterium]
MNLEIGVLFTTAFTIIIAFFNYYKSQKWKRMEFTQNEIAKFEENKNVITAMYILNNPSIDIKVLDKIKKIHLKNLGTILKEVSPDEFNIKVSDAFDEFFNTLEKFCLYVENKLFDKKIAEHFVYTWLDVLGTIENTIGNGDNFFETYMDDYGYKHLLGEYKLRKDPSYKKPSNHRNKDDYKLNGYEKIAKASLNMQE